MIIITIILFWYFDFCWFLPTQIWTVFFIILTVMGIVNWYITTYYITLNELVVRKGGRYYRISFSDMTQENYWILSNPIEVLFGCRTIQLARYTTLLAKGGKRPNIWYDTARFWCIRDYKTVDQIVSHHIHSDCR